MENGKPDMPETPDEPTKEALEQEAPAEPAPEAGAPEAAAEAPAPIPSPPLQALAAMQIQARMEVLQEEINALGNRRMVLQQEIGWVETEIYSTQEKIAPLLLEVEKWKKERGKREEVILEVDTQRRRVTEKLKALQQQFMKNAQAEAAAAPSIPAAEKIGGGK